MREDLVGSQPGGRVLHQEPRDEVLGLAGDAGPVLGREDQAGLFDVGEEKILAGRAGLAPVPPAVQPTVGLEGRVAAHQNVGDDSEGPKITFLVVAETVVVQVGVVVGIILVYEGVDDLRCHVLQTAHWRTEGWSAGVGGVGAEVEITELHLLRLVGAHTEDVVRLDVPVGDTSTVEELDGGGQLADYGAALGLCEELPPLNVLQQRAAVQLLKHEVTVFLLFEELNELNNVPLSPTHVVDLNLFQQFASLECPGLLLDNLDSVLLPVID